MGRKQVMITSNDVNCYGQCKTCGIIFNSENKSRGKLLQDYNRHLNTKRHKQILDYKEINIENNLNNRVAELEKKLENLMLHIPVA
jgi:hypothetical protein